MGVVSSSNKNSGDAVDTDSTSMMWLRTQVLPNLWLCLYHLHCIGFSSLCLFTPGHKMVMT